MAVPLLGQVLPVVAMELIDMAANKWQCVKKVHIPRIAEILFGVAKHVFMR